MSRLQKFENLVAEEFGADYLNNHTDCYIDREGIGYGLDTSRGAVMVDWNEENFTSFNLSVWDCEDEAEYYQTTRKTLKGVKTYLLEYVE